MCGGGGGGDGGAAQREAARQARINAGNQRINEIFQGRTVGINPVDLANIELGQQVYNDKGVAGKFGRQLEDVGETALPYNKYGGAYYVGTPGTVGFRPATEKQLPGYEKQMLDGVFRNGKFNPLNAGAQLFGDVEQQGGFTDDFFNNREQSYLDFAQPQLEDQYEKEKENLIFALARSRRLNSQTRGEKFGDLQQQYDIQRTNVADDAVQMANQARVDINRARSDLISQNNALADPAQIANMASASAQALQAAPKFDPLGPVFQNGAGGLASALEADQKRRASQRQNDLFTINSRGQGTARTIGG